MKRINLISIAIFLFGCGSIYAQNGAITGFCVKGATPATTSGLNSTNTLQGIVPGGSAGCLVQVYLTGTVTPATIYSNISGGSLTNPFRASLSGQWLFYAATGQAYDVVLSSGIPPNTYTSPVTLTGLGSGGGGGGSGSVTNFSANDVTNLLTASVATSTTTPVLSYAIKSAQSGMVPNSTSSTVAGWTYTPFLGALGGTHGSITFAAGANGVTVQGLSAASPSTVSLTGAGSMNNYLGADGSYHLLPIPSPSCPATTFSTTPVYDFSTATCTTITLSNSISSATSSGFSPGILYQVTFIQNGTGNFGEVPPINFKGGPVVINLAANGRTVCNYIVLPDNNFYLQGACSWF